MKFIKFGLSLKIRLLVLLFLSLFIQPTSAFTLYSFVIVGPDNQSIIRTIENLTQCPSIELDGKTTALSIRVAPQLVPSQNIHSSLFPVTVCELSVSKGKHVAILNGKQLPLFQGNPKQIAVIGDTGCRIKAPFAYQSCNHEKDWPLPKLAQTLASEKPDLIIHVGDYLYRESHCVTLGCQGSPEGYGWDSWQEDVFKPLKSAMAVSPLVLIRGNHEACYRAGEGWFRFLDPFPYNPNNACLEKDSAVFDAPYFVMLGEALQLFVFDSAEVNEKKPQLIQRYQSEFTDIQKMLMPGVEHWLALHHPAFGFAYSRLFGWQGGVKPIAQAIANMNKSQEFLSSFSLLLQGHIHTFELTTYQEPYMPLSLISGMGGTQLEEQFPQKDMHGYEVAKEVHINKETSLQDFGYLIFVKTKEGWEVDLKSSEDKVRTQCKIRVDTKKYNCSNL